MNEETTKVIFRKWPKKDGGDVIAIFPEIDEGEGSCSCYQQLGQHTMTDHRIIWNTQPATEAEYASLKKELESEPYNYQLKAIKRWPSSRR